jgi:hypothetical protein
MRVLRSPPGQTENVIPGAPAGPSPARVPEQGRAATRRGPDAGGRAAARSHALTFSARPCARRCHRRRNPRQCGQGFGHGLAFAVWCRCASFACLSVPDTAGNRAPRLASSVLVQYPFVARSVLAVHKVTSRLRDEERRSPFLGAHGSYDRPYRRRILSRPSASSRRYAPLHVLLQNLLPHQRCVTMPKRPPQ